ncbi:MAG: site-2 protease family protein [Streptomycetales bacterium]
MSDDRDTPNEGGRPFTREPGAGVLMGRPFGIPVYVTPTWFIVAVLITVAFAPIVESSLPGIGIWKYVVAFAFAVFLYLSVLVHELSHSVVAMRLGLPVRRITLYLLGGASEIEREPETPGREFLVAVAGPILSLVLGAMGYLLARVVPDGTVTGLLIVQLTFANFLVGGFNLLPGLPLDGGRVLRAAVWKLTGRPLSGTIAAAWAGRAIAVLVLFTPLTIAYVLTGEVDVFQLLWGVLIASFIWLGASQSLRVAKLRGRLPALRARALTRRAVPVPAETPLAEALRQATEVGARGLVVVDPTGRPTALVSEAAVTATPFQRRPWVLVGSVARTLEPGLVVSAELSGEQLVDALRSAPATEYLVVEPSGEIYGVLAATDVERAAVQT